MDKPTIISKSAAILLKDRKLLVVKQKDKDFFISPGGKPEKGEDLQAALVRELREELSLEISPQQFELFGTFSANAAGLDGVVVEMTVFLVKQWDPQAISLNPDDKVNEYRWISTESAKEIQLGSIFEHEVIPRLKKLDLID